MKKFKIYLPFILFICQYGCANEQKPVGVIDVSTMTNLYLEIYDAEAKLMELKLNRDTTMAIFDVYEARIFDKYEIDSQQYQQSLTYYYDHPIELEAIYDAVLDTLTLRESKIKAKQEADKKAAIEARQKADSLAKIKKPTEDLN